MMHASAALRWTHHEAWSGSRQKDQPERGLRGSHILGLRSNTTGGDGKVDRVACSAIQLVLS